MPKPRVLQSSFFKGEEPLSTTAAAPPWYPYSPPQVDRIWGMWGSYYNVPKTIFYLKGDYTPENLKVHMRRLGWLAFFDPCLCIPKLEIVAATFLCSHNTTRSLLVRLIKGIGLQIMDMQGIIAGRSSVDSWKLEVFGRFLMVTNMLRHVVNGPRQTTPWAANASGIIKGATTTNYTKSSLIKW